MSPSPNSAGLRGRARTTGRRSLCPLAVWRTRAPGDIAQDDVRVLADAISSVCMFGQARWVAARSGDPAAAVAVAVDGMRVSGPDGPIADVAMTNLVVLALRDGDPTARPVLARAIRTLARLRPDRTELDRMADAWARKSCTIAGRRRAVRPHGSRRRGDPLSGAG